MGLGSTFGAAFPATPRHRDNGSEHTWEVCYGGGLYRLTCSAAWSGGMANELLEVIVGERNGQALILADRREDRSGQVARRVHYVKDHRQHHWLFVSSAESTFVVSYEGPNDARSKRASETFVDSFYIDPGAECPSVRLSRHDDTRPEEKPLTCP
jgi:hypothetical protein